MLLDPFVVGRKAFQASVGEARGRVGKEVDRLEKIVDDEGPD